MERNLTLDILKGFAVIIMIIANTVPYFYNIENEIFIRLLFSTAAPIFIITSGYITFFNVHIKKVEKSKLYLRICQILYGGVLIDTLFWHSIPFITFDVLYLIAFSQIAIIFVNKNHLLKLTFLIFIISPLLFYFFEYRLSIIDTKSISYQFVEESNPIKRIFFDGWFPIFPWFGFFLLGVLSLKYSKILSRRLNLNFFLGISFLLLYLILTVDNIPEARNKYLELWYPLYGKSLLIPFSLFFVINGIINYSFNHKNLIIDVIVSIGKNTLFIYTLNAFFVSLIIDYDFIKKIQIDKVYIFLLIIIILIGFTIILEKIKNTKFWFNFPKLIKFIILN
jgi:uncharacterized membrane protein